MQIYVNANTQTVVQSGFRNDKNECPTLTSIACFVFFVALGEKEAQFILRENQTVEHRNQLRTFATRTMVEGELITLGFERDKLGENEQQRELVFLS